MNRPIHVRRVAAKNARQRTAENIAAAQAAAHDRSVNPIEQAKTFLRKKGYIPVYSDKRKHIVGRNTFTKDKDLFEFARRKGWEG